MTRCVMTQMSCHALKPHVTEVSMRCRVDVAGAKYCTGLADSLVLGLFLLLYESRINSVKRLLCYVCVLYLTVSL